ncbi:CD83 antigen isoform X2 [Vanacampus margaritifer]
MRTIPMTFFLMSLSGVWARSEVMHVQTVLGANCSLPCRAKIKQGVQYLFVSWYKMQLLGDPPTPKRRGLVTRDLPDGLVEHYLGQKRQVVLENSSNILLPNVTCGDHGSYICRLYAPIGERNLEGEVILQLSDCRDIPVGNLRLDDDDDDDDDDDFDDNNVIIWVSVSLILAVFSFLVVIIMLRRLRQYQKIPWKAINASPEGF